MQSAAALIAGGALALACASPPPPQPLVVTVEPVRQSMIAPFRLIPEGIHVCTNAVHQWQSVEVQQLPDLAVEQRINGRLRALLQPVPPQLFSIDECEQYLDFQLISVAKLATVSTGFLSFLKATAGQFETMSEPLQALRGINIDFETGELIGLEDVFREGSGYRAVLSEYLVPKLLSHCDTHAVGLAEEANPGSYDYQNFFVLDSGFEIVFQPENPESPKDPDPFTVPVPWSRLRPLLKTEGPVAQFVATVPDVEPGMELPPVVPRGEVTCEE